MALDEWYHHRRKDDEGEFYRKVTYQRQGMGPERTTQGFYTFSPDGTLYHGWNHRDTARVRQHLKETLEKHRPTAATPLSQEEDPGRKRLPPEGGLVLDVSSKILRADYDAPPKNEYEKAFRDSLGRDHLWITRKEIDSILRGTLPESLTNRIACFHLIDNTRGEPPMWRREEIRGSKWTLTRDEGRLRLEGSVEISTEPGDRSGRCHLLGFVEAKEGRITRFDLVARGTFLGHGRYTQTSAPKGEFTLAVAIAIADGSEDDKVPPQGARDLGEYLRD